jgi:hypothetical protein
MILILFSNIIGNHTETIEESNMMILRIIKQKQLNLKLQINFLSCILLQQILIRKRFVHISGMSLIILECANGYDQLKIMLIKSSKPKEIHNFKFCIL